VDTDRAAADLDAVEHEVIRAGEDFSGSLSSRCSSSVRGLVNGWCAAAISWSCRRLEQRRIGEPHELPFVLPDQAELVADVQPDRTEARVRDLRLLGDEDQRVTLASATLLLLVAVAACVVPAWRAATIDPCAPCARNRRARFWGSDASVGVRAPTPAVSVSPRASVHPEPRRVGGASPFRAA